MKGKARRVLLVLLALVFVGGGALLLRQLLDYRAADRAYDAARSIALPGAEAPDPSEAPALSETPAPLESVPPEGEPLEENARFLLELDLAALRETNPDVLGWIHVPDSEISYPLMKAGDNDEYLRRAWDGSANSAGCIFLECRNQSDFSDFNTLVYGHHMRNGTMFGSLRNYRERDYWDGHPYVYIVTDEGVRRYEVFSTYEADTDSDTYRLLFEDDARKQSVLDYYMESSVVDGGPLPAVDDRILTLSTCTGTGSYATRWVVQAVLTGEFPKASPWGEAVAEGD